MAKLKTKDEYVDRKMAKITTSCCQVKPERKGRAHYICPKCGADVSMECVYLTDLFYREAERKGLE